MSLLMHRGGQQVELNDLQAVPLPQKTQSYQPVSHYDLAINLGRIAQDLLRDFTMDRSQFGLARDGQQMFGVHTFKNGDENLGLSIGFRNSYDKSMSVGIAIGASVFVCDNLAFTGEVTILRKHTLNVWQDLEEMMVTSIYRSRNNFNRIVEDAEEMKYAYLSNDNAFRLLGFLYGKGVLMPRQLPVVKREWINPSSKEFSNNSLWSFYNCCTEALKSSPPSRIMEKHIKLHELIKQVKDAS